MWVSPFVVCLFSLLTTVSFAEQRFLILSLIYQFVSFIDHAFGVMLRTPLPNPKSWRFSPILKVLRFAFRSMNHFYLILCKLSLHLRSWFFLSFLPLFFFFFCVWMFQRHFFKKQKQNPTPLFSLLNCFCTLVKNELTIFVWCVSGLCFLFRESMCLSLCQYHTVLIVVAFE